MDQLKSLLEKRKPQQVKWQKVSDIEKENKKKFLEQQEQIQEKNNEKLKQKMLEIDKYYSGKEIENLDQIIESGYKKIKTNDNGSNKRIDNSDESEDDEQISEKLLPVDEVKKQLRSLGHPITLFGETDRKRQKRLKKCQENYEEQKQGLNKGNVYNKMIKMKKEEFKKLNEEDQQINEVQLQEFQQRILQNDLTNDRDKRKHEQIEVSKVSYESKCQDTLIWIKKIILEWEKLIEKKFPTEQDKQTIQGKKAEGTYRQTVEYVKPLLELLKKKELNIEILNGIYQVVYFTIKKQYIKANDKYLEIAIGNAPWPMGVTMVGIHERTGRAKIFSSQIAHILNDETQRKYLQSLKRLVTVSQTLYPNEDLSYMISLSEADNFL